MIASPERLDFFWKKVRFNPRNGCWEWQAATNGQTGHGKFWDGERLQQSHRWIYQVVHGVVLLQDTVVRHRCKDNPGCVNPSHLLQGTQRDNVQDAIKDGNHNGAKTHCPNGHEYTDENTRIGSDGSRFCRACAYIHNRKPRTKGK